MSREPGGEDDRTAQEMPNSARILLPLSYDSDLIRGATEAVVASLIEILSTKIDRIVDTDE